MSKFSIIITTKNRKDDLQITLKSLQPLIDRKDVELLICDDASTDGTATFLQENYAKHQLIFNQKSQGLIHNRNVLNNLASGEYLISLDDDANFNSENPLEEIEDYFTENPNCGLISFRIYWNKNTPEVIFSSDQAHRVNAFVGCGHVWRKEAWKAVPDYPAWFIFYGEEEFAAYHLFKRKIEVHYNPKVLVHHRVDIKQRKKEKEYTIRLRRSLRSGWYLYFLFFPWNKIPRLLLYTLWIQLKTKVFKGDFRAFLAITGAILDVFLNLPRLMGNSNRLSLKEYAEYRALEKVKIYWEPNEK